MPEKSQIIIGLKVKALKEIVFILDERFFKEGNTDLRIDFQHRLNINVENNELDLTLRTFYHYLNETNVLVDFQMANIFEIIDSKNLINEKNEFIIPNQLLITMVSLSISHSRALLSARLAGTVCQGILIPIVIPTDITKAFFPDAFTEEGLEKENFLKEELEHATSKTKQKKIKKANK